MAAGGEKVTAAAWLAQAGAQLGRGEAESLFLAAWRTQYGEAHDAAWLILHENLELAPEFVELLDGWAARRAAGEPLAYLTTSKIFYGREFYVDWRVLIPRPETEILIDLAKELVPKTERPLQVLDVGTGSGCIAVTLAQELAPAAVTAVDASDDALAVAQQNAKTYGVNITLQKSDLLTGVEAPEKFDLIVANLPYVDEAWEWLDRVTLDFEPTTALYAKNQGCALIFRLLEQIAKACPQCPLVLLEADPSQHAAIENFAAQLGFKLRAQRGFILALQAAK